MTPATPARGAASGPFVAFDFGALGPKDKYKLLIGAVVPRPIALVTTVDRRGVANAAPFSFFNCLSADPAILALGVEYKPTGAQKDTGRNVRDTQAFTVNIVSDAMVEAMNVCAVPFEPGVDELRAAGLTAAAGVKVPSPGSPSRRRPSNAAITPRSASAIRARSSLARSSTRISGPRWSTRRASTSTRRRSTRSAAWAAMATPRPATASTSRPCRWRPGWRRSRPARDVAGIEGALAEAGRGREPEARLPLESARRREQRQVRAGSADELNAERQPPAGRRGQRHDGASGKRDDERRGEVVGDGRQGLPSISRTSSTSLDQGMTPAAGARSVNRRAILPPLMRGIAIEICFPACAAGLPVLGNGPVRDDGRGRDCADSARVLFAQASDQEDRARASSPAQHTAHDSAFPGDGVPLRAGRAAAAEDRAVARRP